MVLELGTLCKLVLVVLLHLRCMQREAKAVLLLHLDIAQRAEKAAVRLDGTIPERAVQAVLAAAAVRLGAEFQEEAAEQTAGTEEIPASPEESGMGKTAIFLVVQSMGEFIPAEAVEAVRFTAAAAMADLVEAAMAGAAAAPDTQENRARLAPITQAAAAVAVDLATWTTKAEIIALILFLGLAATAAAALLLFVEQRMTTFPLFLTVQG